MGCHVLVLPAVPMAMETPTAPAAPTNADHAHDVVKRLFRAVEESDAVGYFDRTYHPGVVINEAGDLPYGGTYRGLAGAHAHASAFLSTWAPFQEPHEAALNAVIDAVPDHVYVRWTLRVAGRAFPLLSHYAFVDGLIAEATMFPFDGVGMVAWWTELRARAPRK